MIKAGLKIITVTSPFPEERDAIIAGKVQAGIACLLRLSSRHICSAVEKPSFLFQGMVPPIMTYWNPATFIQGVGVSPF